MLFALLVSAALSADAILVSAWAGQAPGTNVSGGRYLFVVDTSASMQRRAKNIQKVVGELLLSGLNSQLRPGDTIGVWTFNEKLNAGNFPLQLWTPQARQRIAVGVVEFLQRQRYEKPTQIDKALAPMMRVVKASEKITVLLISEGDDKVSGTPFDNAINEAFKLNSSAQRKSNMPFVTVLRARKGEFIGANVSMPPWPVEFPEFPAEPPVARRPISQEKPKPEPPKAERTPPTAPSLIVIGKKPEPPTNATPTEAAEPDTAPAPAPTPPPAAPKAEPTPAAATAPATNSIVKNPERPVSSPTSAAESPPVAIRASPQQVTVVPGAPAKPETAPPPTEPTSRPAPVTVTIPDKPKVQATTETSPKPGASIAHTNIAITVPLVAPPPIAPAPAESARATSSPVAAANSEPASSNRAQTTDVQTAVATPSETVFKFTGILIAGIALLVVGLGLVYALMRRSRTPTPVSLITRSMDRDKK